MLDPGIANKLLGAESLLYHLWGDHQREILKEVFILRREMGRGGEYIFSPAKGFQLETPTENAAVVIEAALEQSGATIPKEVSSR